MLTMGKVLMCLVKPKIALVAAQKKLAVSLTSLVAMKLRSLLKYVVATEVDINTLNYLGR